MSTTKETTIAKASNAHFLSTGHCLSQEDEGSATKAKNKQPVYFPIDRPDYAPSRSTTNSQNQTGSSSDISSVQGYDPMERFRSEDVRDQQWHGAASISGFSTSRSASKKEQYSSTPSEACAEKGSSQGSEAIRREDSAGAVGYQIDNVHL